MKLQRWQSDYAGSYYGYEGPDAEWAFCKSEDVAELEAKYAELEAKYAELEAKFDDCAELVCAAKDVIARWGSPRWKWDEHTGDIINRLRQAVAKCEGMEP